MEFEVLRKHGAAAQADLQRVEKLDPHKGSIVNRMRAAAPDRIPAMVRYGEIKARGYDGGETRPRAGGKLVMALDAAQRQGSCIVLSP